MRCKTLLPRPLPVGITLTIRAAKNPGYYEQPEFARDDYYTERGSAPGRWVGRSAETLALAGTPERGQLGTLLEGKSPVTGDELTGGRGRKPSNAGFDLTFTAPKSVSVLLAVGDQRVRKAILAAQDKAAMAGLSYLEQHECFARRGTDGVHVIPAEGFVGAAYMHEMARSGDPHLHTHVVIANRVRASDERWTAPDMRPVYAAAKTAGTIAEATLRHELTRSLGVRWGEVVNGTSEIEGVPQEVLDHFSQRHTEIAELAATRGWLTERGIAEIQRETRDRKPVLDRVVAQADWRARAAEHGLDRLAITKALDQVGDQPQPRELPSQLAKHLAGPNGLTLQESTFTRRDLIRAIAEAHRAGISPDDLANQADAFLAEYGVPISPRDGHEPARYTTLDMLETEARLIKATTAKPRPTATLPQRLPAVDAKTVERVIKKNAHLGEDQADAVRHLTAGKTRLVLLEAPAGYGKTTALRAVREAYEAEGIPVLGTAWQGQAAQELGRGAGIKSHTAARILTLLDAGKQPIPDGAVLVVDEANMMPTRPFERLVQEVAARHGRVIAVGDRGQLPSFDAGGAFASLADRIGVAELKENRRQRGALQIEVTELLRSGKPDKAIALLSKNGAFSSYNDSRWARANLIGDWAQAAAKAPTETALILAHDRRDVDELNNLARAVRDHDGLLGKRRLTAYGREWAEGDRLLCRRNDYRPSVDVRNGTRATVTKVDPKRSALTIRTDDGRTVRLPPDYLQHVDYGYAITGHASEGATVDRTYLLATPDRGGREWGYVAGTRQRIDLTVYAVHLDRKAAASELARTWERSQAKTLALDRMTPANRKMELERATRESKKRQIDRPTRNVLEREPAKKPSKPEAAPPEPQTGQPAPKRKTPKSAPKPRKPKKAPPKPKAPEAPRPPIDEATERDRFLYEQRQKRQEEKRGRRREPNKAPPKRKQQEAPQPPVDEATERDRLLYEQRQKRQEEKRGRRP